MKAYPLLLDPPVKDYIWGGNRLETEFGYSSKSGRSAEAWVLSCHKDGSSIVKNGPLAGYPLNEALSFFDGDPLGRASAQFSYFPLLIKLIDAHDRLSVQVHPDDKYALSHEGEYGKTEMWYVIDCKPGAELIYGLNRSVTKDEFRKRIENNTLTDICRFVPVHPGDVFFIPSGTLHAIGSGILIAEVQQNSNTTYRVFDYGRPGADGKPRPLHIDKAIDVTNTEASAFVPSATGNTIKTDFGDVKTIAACRYFTVEIMNIDGETAILSRDSFTSLVILDGSVVVSCDHGPLNARKGSGVFIPAGVKANVSGKGRLLVSRV